ncbi:MAG TPA: HDIG domain-containing protein, partial [Acidobacteriota bacterium]|nr:HDIG domain-containing protein [Acidobacteriota bacterium]
MKSKIQIFSPKGEESGTRLWQQAKRLLKDRDFWWGLLFIAALLVLFAARMDSTIPNYKIGEIAESTIRAPEDIQVPDSTTTEPRRKEAQQKVLPVHDFEAGAADSSVARIREIIEHLRQLQAANPELKTNYEGLSAKLNNDLGISVDPILLARAAKQGYTSDLETYLERKLRRVMDQYIVTDRNAILVRGFKTITIRNPESNREETFSLTAVQDLRSAEEALKTELEKDETLNAEGVKAYHQFLSMFLVPTIYLNNAETHSRIRSAIQNTEVVVYQIRKGKVIVRDGEEVTPFVMAQLNALRQAGQIGPPIRYSIGILMVLIVAFIALKKYLNTHRYTQIKLRDKALFQLVGLVLVGSMILVKLSFLVATSVSSVFSAPPFNLLFAYQIAAPFAAGILLLAILTDRHIAVISTLAFAILVGVLTKGDFFLSFYALTGGIAAVFSIKRYYQRSALLRSSLLVWLANIFTVVAIYLLREQTLFWQDMLFLVLCAFLSAMLSAAVASIFVPVVEWIFNITTDIKLLELSNLDLPVLRQLALEAPGTYHHSIVMGTIAEAAAEKVGANPLFLRVAALYHDIGKVRKSDYYVENQRDLNKHDSLNPRMSALVIMNHVKEGLEIAKMLRLPSDVANMIPQHHGTRLITYFYKKA